MSAATVTAPPDGPATARGVVARGVRRTFGRAVAVDRVDLDAPAGQVTALIGPNGSGKTTLLLVLAGLLVPDAGAVRVGDVDVVADPVGARALMGWMPDVHGTWDSLTPREVLTTMADAHRVPRAAVAGRVDELLATVHLDDLADAPAHVLSRGQKQRLGLARAIVHAPAVLLLDEPASGLDPRSRVELRATLRSLAAGGTAVVVSSHVLSELDELADRAVLVQRGSVVAVHEGVQDAAVAGAGGADDPRTGPTRRRYRVRALDADALARALVDLRAAVVEAGSSGRGGDGGSTGGGGAGGSVAVDLPDERAAADLLGALVAAGVGVTAFAPAAGVLEQAYLDLDEGERR